jgi:hypothetical protein
MMFKGADNSVSKRMLMSAGIQNCNIYKLSFSYKVTTYFWRDQNGENSIPYAFDYSDHWRGDAS